MHLFVNTFLLKSNPSLTAKCITVRKYKTIVNPVSPPSNSQGRVCRIAKKIGNYLSEWMKSCLQINLNDIWT